MRNTYLLLGKTGDLCAILPFLKPEADAGEKPGLVVSKAFADLLDGCSYVTPLVFDGTLAQLREAKALFPTAKSLQVQGSDEVVAECTYRPAGQETARTTSFVKEYWKLAGKLDRWDECWPLVFDKRSTGREEELVAKYLTKKRGRPGKSDRIVLVAAGSASSPFPYRELLWTLLRLKFTKGYRLLDLSAIKAHRFYDLLALYERAHCLVSVDSAPLHLARACPDLPVMALTNDRPILWNGSAWEPNWHWVCRYHDFPERAVGLIKAIETCRNLHPGPIIHLWNNYDLSEPPEDYSRNCLPVWPGACGRDSANCIHDERRIPYLKDCLRMAIQRARKDEWISVSAASVKAEIRFPSPPHPMFAYRMKDGQFYPIADLFVAMREWWKERLPEIPDFLYGRDHYWSDALRVLFQKHGALDITGACERVKP